MNEFEFLVSRINDKAEAISIHRTAVCFERNLNYLLLDTSYYNAIKSYRKEHEGNMIYAPSVIWHFRADPEYAESYMRAVLEDGIDEEVDLVSRWYRLARALGPIRRRILRKA